MSNIPTESHTPEVLTYLRRIYSRERRNYECPTTNSDEIIAWQGRAREALSRIIGLDAIGSDLAAHSTLFEKIESFESGAFVREKWRVETEPDLFIPFWLLRPNGPGPFPLAIMPHGHTHMGADQYAGLSSDDMGRRLIVEEQRDVAIQAVQRGFLAIAPTTRGFDPKSIPDLNGRHGGSPCRSQLIHCLLAGRTALAERLWDLTTIFNWALKLPQVTDRFVVMLGNSGGGVLSALMGALDTRVSVVIPNCCVCTFVGEDGSVHLCDCNTVPGLLKFGEFHDVLGLIFPRYLLVVHGRYDNLYPIEEVKKAVKGITSIYHAGEAKDRFTHYFGDGGCRFYSDAMWSFIENARL